MDARNCVVVPAVCSSRQACPASSVMVLWVRSVANDGHLDRLVVWGLIHPRGEGV